MFEAAFPTIEIRASRLSRVSAPCWLCVQHGSSHSSPAGDSGLALIERLQRIEFPLKSSALAQGNAGAEYERERANQGRQTQAQPFAGTLVKYQCAAEERGHTWDRGPQRPTPRSRVVITASFERRAVRLQALHHLFMLHRPLQFAAQANLKSDISAGEKRQQHGQSKNYDNGRGSVHGRRRRRKHHEKAH